LPELSEPDRENIGVLLGHRKIMLKAIAALRPQAPPPLPDRAPAAPARNIGPEVKAAMPALTFSFPLCASVGYAIADVDRFTVKIAGEVPLIGKQSTTKVCDANHWMTSLLRTERSQTPLAHVGEDILRRHRREAHIPDPHCPVCQCYDDLRSGRAEGGSLNFAPVARQVIRLQ
jgi:hypothetical protein